MPEQRLFLSYAWEDLAEVEQLDRELRRRGVPLWRDREDLLQGRPTDRAIEEAANGAAGFIFYLTKHAAESEWVRETERALALDRVMADEGFQIHPIFRLPPGEIAELMLAKASSAADPKAYDLGAFAGYAMRQGRLPHGIGGELARAADGVLAAKVEALGRSLGPGTPLRLGVGTRQAKHGDFDRVHLLLDASKDFPLGGEGCHDTPPDPAFCRQHLDPALDTLANRLLPQAGNHPLQIQPRCHLSLAMALGFRFRRNTGVGIEAVEPNDGAIWVGPRLPLEAATGAWETQVWDAPRSSPSDLGLAINVTRDQDDFKGSLEGFLKREGPGLSSILYFEPSQGPSHTSLKGVHPELPHRMVMSLLKTLTASEAFRNCGRIHLFYGGPPALAILLAQQLANLPLIQTYEWLSSTRTYAPCFQLKHS